TNVVEDLSEFEVEVEGTVNLESLSGLGFVPEVQLGGDVITPDSPPDERTVRFVAEVEIVGDAVVVRPYDIDGLALGFRDLHVGPLTLAGSISSDGYVDGELQPLTIAGSITAAFDDLDIGLDLALTGDVVEGPNGPEAHATGHVAFDLLHDGGV